MSTILTIRNSVRMLIAVFAAVAGMLLMSSFTEGASAQAATGTTTQTAAAKTYSQMIGPVGSHTAASCKKEGRAIVKTNMYGRGGKFNRTYYKYTCHHVEGNKYNLVAYWIQR